MKTIKDIESLNGKKVLVRVDYNVPMKNGIIIDDFRIKKSLESGVEGYGEGERFEKKEGGRRKG